MAWNRSCWLTGWVWICLDESVSAWFVGLLAWSGSALMGLGLLGWLIVATQPIPFHSILGMEWNGIGFVGLLGASGLALISLGLPQCVWVYLAASL